MAAAIVLCVVVEAHGLYGGGDDVCGVCSARLRLMQGRRTAAKTLRLKNEDRW
jgi:hypothetical protein